MTRNTTGVSMPESMVENIDENYVAAGYHSRSDLIRDAVRDKLSQIERQSK
ncbi:ribbon-helix-helix domain-containing protein [Haloarcula sp. CBA1127]|uniref:ribbon-helix-helix domain-containing protein n=1 Tax=Haloarcula sp. CBA1127 TaxID=1765055 RepID=UPI0009ABE8A6